MSLSPLPRAIAGADGCRAGWIAAVRFSDGSFAARPFARFADLLAFAGEDAVVAVDMPVGLPDRIGAAGRGPEAALRRVLGPFGSSVFSIPSREAVHAACGPFADSNARSRGFSLACKAARRTSDPPRAFSIQAFGLFPKIRELDALLRADGGLARRVVESHPEAAFRRLNGERPLKERKKWEGPGKAGVGERRALLLANGLPPELLDQRFPGVAEDDLLDAAVLLFSAARFAEGKAQPFPDPPGRDAFGLPIAIWV